MVIINNITRTHNFRQITFSRNSFSHRMYNFPPQVVSRQQHILKYSTIPLQSYMLDNIGWVKSLDNLKKIRFDRSLNTLNKNLMQRRLMPTRLIPNIPPKVPNMSSKGALEKETRECFCVFIAQHILRRSLKAASIKVIPSKILDHQPQEKVAFGPIELIPNMFPPQNLNVPKSLPP